MRRSHLTADSPGSLPLRTRRPSASRAWAAPSPTSTRRLRARTATLAAIRPRRPPFAPTARPGPTRPPRAPSSASAPSRARSPTRRAWLPISAAGCVVGAAAAVALGADAAAAARVQPGEYQPQSSQSQCLPCPPGKYNPLEAREQVHRRRLRAATPAAQCPNARLRSAKTAATACTRARRVPCHAAPARAPALCATSRRPTRCPTTGWWSTRPTRCPTLARTSRSERRVRRRARARAC
jgi:hypothetical protein